MRHPAAEPISTAPRFCSRTPAAAVRRPSTASATSEVWYALVEAAAGAAPPRIEHVPLAYDHHRLAAEMRAEELPEEFVETILTGWWTTCLEILPAKERAASRF